MMFRQRFGSAAFFWTRIDVSFLQTVCPSQSAAERSMFFSY
jgi:hypothetical protein